MNGIEKALQGELKETMGRLRDLGGAVALENYPGAPEDDGQGDAGGDAASLNEERELSFAVRGRLVVRANRLAEALDRLHAGDYGVCQVCGNQIAPGRLRAIPEVTTCVICQDAAEQEARGGPARVGAR